jgi:hypothetical protein
MRVDFGLPLFSVLLCVHCVATMGAQTANAAPEVLPDGQIRQAYYQQLSPPQPGTPPWHWRLLRGTLPPGIALDPTGILAGAPTSPGEFRFTLEASDSSTKPVLQTREYVVTVPPPLAIQWTQPPHVTSDGGISGELQVTNGLGHTLDLAVIVVAVNSFNKAFALGYQHFNFSPGSQRIPFGSTLPRDSYVVHADAIGESAETYEIYRARLQTAPLTVQ